MKINRLETHDRLLSLIKKQAEAISQGAEDCLKKNPLALAIQEKSPYIYLFGHARTTDDGLNKRILWQPRLSIPPAQSNSNLFRAISHSDIIEIIWMIPQEEFWDQYQKGFILETNDFARSIEMFKHKKMELEKPHPDDMPEERARLILKAIVDEKLQDVRSKRVISEAFSTEMDS